MVQSSRAYFICHKSSDAELASSIARALDAAGQSTWISSRDIPLGAHYPEEITRAIRNCDVVLLVGTGAALNSAQVENEITLADRFRRQVIPLLLDDSVLPPSLEYLLAAAQYLITNPTDVVDDLLNRLGLKRPRTRYGYWNREVVDIPQRGSMTLRRWGDGYSHPVLLIHGLGCDADDWNATAQLTSMRGRPLTFIAPDLPQHMAWNQRDPISLPRVGALLGEMMAQLGYERYSVVGHSLGGLIGLHLTSIDQRVQRCVVGGVTVDNWNSREYVISLPRSGTANNPGDASLLEFLASRGHQLEGLARLCEGRLPAIAALKRITGRVRIITTNDDLAGARIFAEQAGFKDPMILKGTHVSSFIEGTFLAAALDYLSPATAPRTDSTQQRLIVVSGLPGAGKTTLAIALRDRLGLDFLSRDGIRHELADNPSYDLDESERVGTLMSERINTGIAQGRSIVAEATAVQPAVRRQMREALQHARSVGVDAHALWLRAEEQRSTERLRARDTEPRPPEDQSEANESIYEVMRSRARPGWVGVPCDVTDLDHTAILSCIEEVTSGVITDVELPSQFLMDAILADGAMLAAQSGLLPKGDWVSRLLEMIRHDAMTGVFSRWGTSTLLDSSSNCAMVLPGVLADLLLPSGLQGEVDNVNAGLAHCYAYLFSNIQTPHGLKRDRWVDGRLARVLGVRDDWLTPLPRQGSLLSNLTAALDAYLVGQELEWLDRTGVSAMRLIESDPVADLNAVTWILSRHGHDGHALVHTATTGGSTRYITAFPVRAPMVDKLIAEAKRTDPLTPRFNAVLPAISSEPAHRTWESSFPLQL